MGPHAKNHVDRIQEGLCSWRITSPPRGVVFNQAIALSSREAEMYAGMRRISETLGFVHLMREFQSK